MLFRSLEAIAGNGDVAAMMARQEGGEGEGAVALGEGGSAVPGGPRRALHQEGEGLHARRRWCAASKPCFIAEPGIEFGAEVRMA